MDDFKIDEKRIDYICSQFGIVDPDGKRTVSDLHRDFLYFYNSKVKGQYLASIVIAMERYIQEAYKKSGFRITTTLQRGATAKCGISFLRWSENRYDISIPTNNEDISIRNIVAHELGHLFYVMNSTQGGSDPDLVKDGGIADKMADILGIFTISERTDFYVNRAPSIGRDNFNDIVVDFKKMGIGRPQSRSPIDGTLR